jgi:hypothetical protein
MAEYQNYILQKQRSLLTISTSRNTLALQLLLTHATILNRDENIKNFRKITQNQSQPINSQTTYWNETHMIKNLFKAINEHFYILEQTHQTKDPMSKELKEAIDFLINMTRNTIREATDNALKTDRTCRTC